MAMNRSPEEYEMRRVVETWGRRRWPGARVVHELVVAQECRVDMAFIEPDIIVGVEIKSSKDKLDRLETQMRVFREHLPLAIAALHPKWKDAEPRTGDGVTIYCDGTGITDEGWFWAKPRRSVTVQMLDLLWAAEARAVAHRKRVSQDPRLPLYKAIDMLARALTGDEIVAEVCRELRARDAFPKHEGHPPSDAPIIVGAATPEPPIKTSELGLFRA